MMGGKIIDPNAEPDIQTPLASPLKRTKYEVTMYTVGGNDNPAPVPTKNP